MSTSLRSASDVLRDTIQPTDIYDGPDVSRQRTCVLTTAGGALFTVRDQTGADGDVAGYAWSSYPDADAAAADTPFERSEGVTVLALSAAIGRFRRMFSTAGLDRMIHSPGNGPRGWSGTLGDVTRWHGDEVTPERGLPMVDSGQPWQAMGEGGPILDPDWDAFTLADWRAVLDDPRAHFLDDATTVHASWTGTAIDANGTERDASVTASFHLDPGDDRADLLSPWGAATIYEALLDAAGWALWHEAADIVRDQIADATTPFPVSVLHAEPGRAAGRHIVEVLRDAETPTTVQAFGHPGDVHWGDWTDTIPLRERVIACPNATPSDPFDVRTWTLGDVIGSQPVTSAMRLPMSPHGDGEPDWAQFTLADWRTVLGDPDAHFIIR